MEVQGDDSFRIRSYRRAAEALEGLQEQVAVICEDEKALLAIPGIGKSMATNIREICTTGKLTMHQELLKKYGASILDLLKLQGLGPKTIALILTFPGIKDVLAKGDNKVSFKLLSGLQVDVRLLPPESFGAALQYFTGSKSHSVTLRQRALRMGYTLNEYGLATVKDEKRVAGKTEEEIYKTLGLAWIPPDLRETLAEIHPPHTHDLPNPL